MPKISVIVPVYKTKPYLEKCVHSILNQSFSDFEVILVDDGSPDDSGELCDLLAKSDERIKVIHKENGGLTSARKAAFEIATGDYISFVDSDDYLDTDFLKKMITAALDNNAEVVFCCENVVDEFGKITRTHSPIKDRVVKKSEIFEKYTLPIIGRIYDGKHINLPGFLCDRLFKSSTLKMEYFVSERDVFTEDDIFCILHSSHINNFVIVDEPLYYYVLHEESLTNSYREGKMKMLQNRYNLCEKWLNDNNLYLKGQERLYAAAVSAVNATIDNAVLLNKYSDFKAEIKELEKSKLFQEAYLNVDLRQLTCSQKLNYYFLKLKLVRLLYILRKARLKV